MNDWPDQWFDSWQGLVSNQPWQSVLEDWWRECSSQGQASPSAQVLEKIATQSRSFFKLAEELSKTGAGQGQSADWQTGLDQMFDGLKQAFGDPSSSQAQNLFWQMPLANWQRTASSLSSLPGDYFSSAAGHPAFDARSKLDEVLSAPGLGYTRESQADLQQFTRLVLEYQRAQQSYDHFFVEMSKQSLDAMRDRLLLRMEDGEEPITSVRELYDLWVDCSEAVYGERVLSDEYSRLNGEMINALMALKQHGARISDEMAGMMNMPTRQEVDTVHQRFQVSRRAGKALEQEVEILNAREKDLSEQVERLLTRITKLESVSSTSSPPPTKKRVKRVKQAKRVKRANPGSEKVSHKKSSRSKVSRK
jgi:class III poly(R)-hydroxyalkanoic acid synthase PhaE subunit